MTGGRGGGDGGGGTLDSTELLLPSADSWTYSAALPSTRYSLRGAHWTIKWWWQVQTQILWYLCVCVTNYFTNKIIHYTIQGASTEMTTILTTRTCWNMTSRRENGTRLGPCQSSGASMPLLSSITTPLRNTAIDVISYKFKKIFSILDDGGAVPAVTEWPQIVRYFI